MSVFDTYIILHKIDIPKIIEFSTQQKGLINQAKAMEKLLRIVLVLVKGQVRSGVDDPLVFLDLQVQMGAGGFTG